MDRSKYKALKKELKALIPKDDSLQSSVEAYDDNFYLSFLYSENIYTVEQAMQFCIKYGIKTQTDMLEYFAKKIFKT